MATHIPTGAELRRAAALVVTFDGGECLATNYLLSP